MRPETIQLNTESTPRKNKPSNAVMISTMIAVRIVSGPVGQTTFAVSARTCRINSPGLTLATVIATF